MLRELAVGLLLLLLLLLQIRGRIFGSSAEIPVYKICLPLSLVQFVLVLPLPLNQELSSAKVRDEKGDLFK